MDFSPLLEKYPIEEHEEIHKMRMDHFKQLKLEEFGDSPAGKFVIEYFDSLINGIEARLLSAEPFQVGEREVFIERRQNFRLFKSLFELARKRADNIEEFAKSKL
jgi:hypothetical protein